MHATAIHRGSGAVVVDVPVGGGRSAVRALLLRLARADQTAALAALQAQVWGTAVWRVIPRGRWPRCGTSCAAHRLARPHPAQPTRQVRHAHMATRR